ncbi:MAG: peptide chain release factor N(5)-glutamine methyltransferase [Pseudomonadota bacterium]
MYLSSLLAASEERLAAVSDSPRLDAELLLAHALGTNRTWLFTHADEAPPETAHSTFEHLLRRRIDGEPVAYILGHREFWSLSLRVSPATLVPRPETERLVEIALELLPRRQAQRIADLGTGSGAIALAIASERPDCQLVASDLSEAALAVAEDNARRLNIGNVEFQHSDWCHELRGKPFDLVVANPPYVAEGDPALDSLQAEPVSALVAGPRGLDDIERLAGDVREILKIGGHFLVEHGEDQEPDVRDIFERHHWTEIHCYKDHSGRPRVTSGIVRG